jgi:hypothetical protein
VIKKTVAKKHATAIATKKTVAKNIGNKSASAKKPVKKKLHAMKLSDCN